MGILVIILAVALIIVSVLSLRRRRRYRDGTRGYLRTIRELNILNELSASLHATLDRKVILETIMEKAKDLLKAEKSAIIIIDKHERVTDFYSSPGSKEGCKSEIRGVIRKVVREPAPLRTDNIHEVAGFQGFPDRHPDIKSLLMVPIMLRGHAVGVLTVADKKELPGFSSEDEDLLLSLAFHSAFAIEKVNFHEEIAKMASTDGLTGLNNHRTFQERLEEEVERSRRFGHKVSLLMLDIDHFKKFNDIYGHVNGDEVLKRIGCILLDNIRTIDFAARYGGEEFAIILPGISLEGAKVVAERLRVAVENYVLELNGKNPNVTFSIGVAIFPEDAFTREELIDKADKALYLAKRTGRNRVCAYSEEPKA